MTSFVHVTLPATLPFILTGMRLAMGNSFATVVAAEMIAADSGLGFLIFDSRLWMATDKIFIGIVCLGTLQHDPEKWVPVFGKRSCSSKKLERDDDSKKSHHALGLITDRFFRYLVIRFAHQYGPIE
jgi:hypothetical protein